MIFLHSVLRLFEKKKNTRRVHRARHRAIAQNRRKNAPNGSLRSSMHVAEPSLPFLRAFARLRASLRVTFSSTFSSLKPLFFCSYFFFFSLLFLFHFCLSRAFERHNFERVVRARSEGEPQKKTAIHGSRDAEVCYSNDHVSGGATSAPHLLRISSSRKCKIFLLASVFVGRPIFAFRARTHFARNRTHATLLSQNNLPKHLKWISTMCETQFFTPCEVHSTSGKVRFETHVQHASCVYTKISTLCRESF